MSDSLFFLLPIGFTAVMLFIMYRAFWPVYQRYRNTAGLMQRGTLGVADVVSVSQTGVTINQQPEMRLVLDVENTGGQPRRVEARQVLDLGIIPRAGDRVYVLIDPTNPANVVLSPSPTGSGIRMPVAAANGQPASTMSLDNPQLVDMMALTPELQKNGRLGIATVVAISPTATKASQLVLTLDNIGQPGRTVTSTQVVQGTLPAVGSRVYVFVSPTDPNMVALVPPSFTGGQVLPAHANRLDPLVLGPQLLKVGAKADGTVLSATADTLANTTLAGKGFSKWDLELTVKPQNGTPAYQATLIITLSSQEKVDKIAHSGAEVPLRYDPLDLQTISIDTLAMGYPDPYEALLKAFEEQR